MSSTNPKFAAIEAILAKNGVVKEEVLLATHAKALMLISNKEFAQAALPAELRIFNTVEDGDVARDRFLREPALTLAVIHGAAMYVKAGLEGRTYDSSIVLNSFNAYGKLDSAAQREIAVETMRFADGVLFDVLSYKNEDEQGKAFINESRGLFDEMSSRLADKHINVMLEGFGTVLLFLGALTMISSRLAGAGAEFGDAVGLHKMVGQKVTAKLRENSDDVLAALIHRNLVLNLSEEDMEQIDALVMANASQLH